MCVIATITVEAEGAPALARLAEMGLGTLRDTRGLISRIFNRSPPIFRELNIDEGEGRGCAYSLFSDDGLDGRAGTSAELAAEHLPHFLNVVTKFVSLFPGSFTLYLRWIGDAPTKEIKLTADELLQVIANNRLELRTAYLVRSVGTSGMTA